MHQEGRRGYGTNIRLLSKELMMRMIGSRIENAIRSIVDESATIAIGASSSCCEGFADLRFVLWMPQNGT